ncbi:hypothetical protein SAMN05660464_0742 [Geodermatophilus dictyosporus]|uniref:Uncharacterized protein n=1 Tax=Geodermatophilus dictyosporus TaxID=1523247 RepID=A0A1I5JHM8_9ACTN|nr:hypothetical protein [Geodermatophilus dictyosporus]SFO72053.1 hypothetical protein SAMN05660464_0742 [Geodermatophilus dictyosporus]
MRDDVLEWVGQVGTDGVQDAVFGRALAVSVAGLTARTPEEVDRGLLLVAAMNLLDVLTALGAARGSGRPTTVRAVASSAVHGAAALAVRAMD